MYAGCVHQTRPAAETSYADTRRRIPSRRPRPVESRDKTRRSRRGDPALTAEHEAVPDRNFN